jgi:hypothetical protein
MMLSAGTTLLLASAPAFAADSTEGAIVVNGQLNLAPVFTELNATIMTVTGDASATAAAVGNTATIITNTDTIVKNNQGQGGDVLSWLSATAKDVGGDVSLWATSVCNGASVSTDPRITSVDSVQKCWAKDPAATVWADVSNVGGQVGVGAHAVSNQIEIDSDAAHFPVNNWQETHAGSFATVNTTVRSVGAVGIQSTAVGNTAQIIHLGGHTAP